MDDAAPVTFRRNGVTVTISAEPAPVRADTDEHARCRIPGRPSTDRLVFYPVSHADLVLPVEDPGDVESCQRQDIGIWRAGVRVRDQKPASTGLPFGLPSRHLLMFLCTEARRTGRTIAVRPHEVHAFLARLGSLPRFDMSVWTDHLIRVIEHRWFLSNTPKHVNPTNMLISQWRWHGKDALDPGNDCAGVLTLDHRVAETALEWVALDADYVRKFSLRSCTALDVYIWMTAVAGSLNETTQFSWTDLHRRFGAEGAEPSAIRVDLQNLIDDAAAACATVAVHADATGVELRTLVEPADVLYDMDRRMWGTENWPASTG